MAELEKLFNLEGIQKGGARFDYEKAKWVNHQHLQLLEAKTLVQEAAVQEQLIGIDPNKHIDLIKLLKERLFTINDLKEEVHWVKAPFPMDEKIASKLSSKNPQNLLKEISNNIETMEELSDLKERIMTWSKENEIPVGILMQSLRMALVGKLTGPDLFEICKVLGKDVTLKRIDQAISYFNLKSKSL
jgi:glutamyl-tRNA synthetase